MTAGFRYPSAVVCVAGALCLVWLVGGGGGKEEPLSSTGEPLLANQPFKATGLAVGI